MSSFRLSFGSATLLTIILLCLNATFVYAEGILSTDHLILKFVDGTQLVRTLNENGIMFVGIESIDSLAVAHHVIYYKKLAKDYASSSSYAMYYNMYFDSNKENIEEIRQIYNNDYYVEFAWFDYYDTTENEWIPDDYFFDFADQTHDPYQWPQMGMQDCGGYDSDWGDVFCELWALRNDGFIYVREDFGQHSGWAPIDAESGEDINAVGAWKYYLEETSDPNGIPGDPGVLIGHIDTGVDYDNVEIQASLWHNPLEDHGLVGVFSPDDWWEDDGDIGSPSGGWRYPDPNPPPLWNDVPGGIGDDDGDGAANWADPGIIEIISNFRDNDGDGNSEDEPHIAPPPGQEYHCDCPHSLIGVVDPNDPWGRSFSAEHLGDVGVDDDQDGYIDECDGAMWDDDENGYVDDVIGWKFEGQYSVGHNNPTVDGNSHGSQTIGYSVASANNEEPFSFPITGEPCYNYPRVKYDSVRTGMVGVCPDCKAIELMTGNYTPLEEIFYGSSPSVGAKIFVQAAGFMDREETGNLAFSLGGTYFSAVGNDLDCIPNLTWEDIPTVVSVAGTNPNGSCATAVASRRIDVSAPGKYLMSTRGLLGGGNGTDQWYNASVGWIGTGTSSAVQFVAGAAGLLFSYSKLNGLNWTNGEVMARIINGSKIYGEIYPGYPNGYFPEYSRYYNGSDGVPIGVGRLDVFRALTATDFWGEPNLDFQAAHLDIDVQPGNNDGFMSRNETLGLYVEVFNYGGSIYNAQMTLICDDPYVQLINPSFSAVEVAPYSLINNQDNPFIIYIAANSPPGHGVTFDLEIVGDNIEPFEEFDIASGDILLERTYSVEGRPLSLSRYPVAGELDGDNLLEIVTSSTGSIFAINVEDGTLLWENGDYYNASGSGYGSASIGDINNDSFNEIVYFGADPDYKRYIVVLNHDGSTYDTPLNFPSSAIHRYNQPPILADWDNDNDLDIIFAFENVLYIYDNRLTDPPIFHFDAGISITGIATADLNSDNMTDLVIGLYDHPSCLILDGASQAVIFSDDGSDEWGMIVPASIGDLDNDSQLEIVYFNLSPSDHHVRMIDYSGGEWYSTIIGSGDFDYRNLSLGDWNNDEILEIYYYDDSINKFHVNHSTGSYITIPDQPLPYLDLLKDSDIIIGDINGDGFSDAIFEVKGQRSIYGFSIFETGIWGEDNLKILQSNLSIISHTPIISDFNGDDIVDIFNSTAGSLELWNTGGNLYEGALQWPQYRHDARRTSLYAQPVTTLFVTQDMTIWDNLVVWDGIYIQNGATLTIKPGVSIKMKPGSSIDVLGSLIAEGNPSEPISFTGTEATAGSWLGIAVVAPEANVDLKNCIIKHGRYGIIGEGAEYATIRIDSTTIGSIEDIGIVAGGADVRVTNSKITACGNMGIYVFSGILSAENNSILNIYLYGIRVEDSPGIIGGTSEIIGNVVGLENEPPNGSIGIYCDGCELLRCYGNDVFSFDQAGIKLSNGIYEVEENIIHNIDFSGLTFSNFAQSEVVFRNQISSVEICVWCEGQSYPILGLDEENLWGYNSFTNFIKYGVHNYNPDPEEILAQRNWWGEPECPEFDSPVLCEPPLIENPFAKAVVEDPSLPREFMLHQNYPNPFNSNTIIRFDLPRRSDVTIRIYNILGQLVNTLVDRNANPGYHSIIWDGENASGKSVASGIYLYNIVAGDYRSSKKMTILK